jgi:hypothetical protein
MKPLMISQRTSRQRGSRILVIFLSLGGFLSCPAQTAPPPQDPYLTLMMSQPKIQTDGPVDPFASFDPPSVKPGQQAIYRVTLRALEQTVRWPETIPAPKELQMTPGGHAQTFQMASPSMMSPLTDFNLRVQTTSEGEFTVPEFTLEVGEKRVTVPAAKLIVTANPTSAPPAFKLLVELNRKEVFVGEPVGARVFLQGPSGTFQALQQPQLTGTGFIVDQGAVRQQMGNPVPGGNGIVYMYETLVTPIQAGRLSLFAQGFISGNRLPGNIMITVPGMIMGGSPVLLESAPIEFVAKSLPKEGELPGFTGAIGRLTMDPPTLETNRVRSGEPVKLTVTVHGDTNLLRVIAPPPPSVQDWEIFAGNSNSPAPQMVQARHFFTFDYTLIPLRGELKNTPPIPFSYYDPQEGKYEDLSIPSVTISVDSEPAAAGAATLAQKSSDQPASEPEPVLSGLASKPGRGANDLRPLQRNPWFLGSQAVPAILFLGIWKWDKRRRFLQEHPEIILRRRARRALRQEQKCLRDAVRRRDAGAFASTAVRALRVSCAPHYPAEPRALVGSDVLKILEQTGEADASEKVVREVFAADDSGKFATESRANGDLLQLEHEFKVVLQKLEARL